MKKILLILLGLSLSVATFAQKFNPEIKKGTAIQCAGYRGGQEFPLTLTIKSMSSPVVIAWEVPNYGEGSFEMTDKALESSTKMWVGGNPSMDVTKLPEDQTYGLISKAAYKTLMETKTFTYSGMKFNIKADAKPMQINGKDADVTNIVSENGKFELWILNNPNFPLIVQSAGMPIDIVATEIK